MTTIAYDGKILAADSRISCGNMITSDVAQKIHAVVGDFRDEKMLWFAGAGCWQDIHALLQGLDREELEISAVLFTDKNIWLHEGRNWYKHQDNEVFAIGSGAPFALSALKLGLNSKDAVKHACKLDVFSGGLVKTVKIKG